MLSAWYVAVPVGAALGFLSGLGVGGGSLLILWLTLVLGMESLAARGINLMFFVPSAVIACLFRWKQGTLPLKKILPAAAAGCGAAVLFVWVGTWMDPEGLKRLFGALLLVTGLRELFYRPRKAK